MEGWGHCGRDGDLVDLHLEILAMPVRCRVCRCGPRPKVGADIGLKSPMWSVKHNSLVHKHIVVDRVSLETVYQATRVRNQR